MTRSATKVLHVIPGLGIGGAETCLARLVTASRDRPLTSAIIALQQETGSPIEQELQRAGVSVHHLSLRGPANFLPTVLALAGHIRRERPDCIQGWLYYGDLLATLALWLSGRRPETRLYWGVRCSDMELGRYRRHLRLAVRACASLSRVPDAVIANSSAGRRVHKAMGYRPSRFEVICNGIDTTRFKPHPDARAHLARHVPLPPEGRIVTIAARVDPQKDYDTFLGVVDRLPDVTFLAAGLGTQELPRRNNLITLGPRSDMPGIYAASDLLVSTSAFGEGFPNVIGEAMACGVPAVSTDVGDAAEIIGKTGTTTPVRDAAAIADAIVGLLTEAPVPNRQRRHDAREHIRRNYSLDAMITAFDTLHATGKCHADTRSGSNSLPEDYARAR